MCKRTNEEFINIVKSRFPNIVILGKYKDAHTKVLCKCLIDGYEWYTEPNTLVRRKNYHGCPKCSGKAKYSTEEIDVILSNLNIERIGDYVNTMTPVKCRCKYDGYVWSPYMHHIIGGVGCPMCGGVGRHTTESFASALKNINNTISIVGEYVNNKTKIQYICKVCGHKGESSPNLLLRGRGCPRCSFSKGERRISNYLDSLNIQYETQFVFPNCKYKHPMRFDFYIPSINTVIEYDGEHHFQPVNFSGKMSDDELSKQIKTNIEKDKIKDAFCKEHNINMIRIPYTEYNLIEKLLQSKL